MSNTEAGSKIMIAGDVHMDFGALNSLMNKKRPDLVLQLGDFGFWPNSTYQELFGRPKRKHDKDLPKPKPPKGTHIHWIDGNHEDYNCFSPADEFEFWPRVHYQPRGSSILLPDGRRVLFMGGAASHDKWARTAGYDWFPEEIITQADIDRVDFSLKYDIVLSHTCPQAFSVTDMLGIPHYGERDPSAMALDIIYEKVRPELWYFGHWHRYKTGYIDGTRWQVLDHTSSGNPWWQWLPGV